MQARLHLQFRMFEAAGEVPCASLDEASALFTDYAGNAHRREREGVTAVWVTCGGETVLGDPPRGWAPAGPFFQLYDTLRRAERLRKSRVAAAERLSAACPASPVTPVSAEKVRANALSGAAAAAWG